MINPKKAAKWIILWLFLSALVFLFIKLVLVVVGEIQTFTPQAQQAVIREHSVYWISEERYVKIDGYGNNKEIILLTYSLDGVVQLSAELQSEDQVGEYMAWVEKKYRRAK